MYTRNALFVSPTTTRSNVGDWQSRHNEAIIAPRGPERPIVRLCEAWLAYAEQHRKRYESPIGEDGVLGQEWAAIGLAIRGLLNGETGNLDCGTLDAFVLNTLKGEGWEKEEEENQ
jgi:hypothetical protein